MRLLGVSVPFGLAWEAVDVVDAVRIWTLEGGCERGGLGIITALELADGPQRAVMEVHVPIEPFDKACGGVGV